MLGKPRFTIITPTLQRESLVRCCESVDKQTFRSWEHVVMADVEQLDQELVSRVRHSGRLIAKCKSPHQNFGNTCRHNAWTFANGQYLLYLDDDNYLADDRILEDMMNLIVTPWALFPILRHGGKFFTDPPRSCHVDTANVVVSREIGRWPNIPDYTADGQFVESLLKYPYQAFPDFRPIVVMEKSNEGK